MEGMNIQLPKEVWIHEIFPRLSFKYWGNMESIVGRTLMLEAISKLPLERVREDFDRAVEEGYLATVQILLEDGRVEPSCGNVLWASDNGHLEVARAILNSPKLDPSIDNNWFIRYTCWHGYTDIVRMLLADPRVDPTVNNNEPLSSACQNGRVEIVRLLLEDGRVDPNSISLYLIHTAHTNGDEEIVKLLKEYTNK